MHGHNEWFKRGFEHGVFLLAGSLQPGLGGGIMEHNTSRSELEERVNGDPFVAKNVVKAKILELAGDRSSFLIE